MSGRHKKIVRVNSRRPINIDQVFFGAVAVYLCIVCYMGLTTTHVSGYEVNTGTLSVNHSYTGFAIRQETVYQTEIPGYVSYYASAGDRVSGSSLIYTVDEKGEVNQLIQENAESVDLTDDNFSMIRNDISSYMNNYSNLQFQDAYSFKSSMESSVLELLNQNMLDSMEAAGDDSMFTKVYSGGIGILEYYTDGYEDVSIDSLTEDMIHKVSYEKTDLKKELVQSGENIYKLAQSEKWSLIVPLTEEEASRYQADGTSYMQVEFLRDHTTAWASFSVIQVGATSCARLDFNNSMVRFADLRYIDVKFLVDDKQGLKIPNTSIVEKEFYLIPKDYAIVNEEDNSKSFLKEVYSDDGTAGAESLNMTIYYEDDDYYYLDPMETDYTTGELKLTAGTYLLKEDSSDKFAVGQKGSLQGVYNINKGYTQFRQISILAQNEEYTLVEEGTSYGLTVYDRIVLNGSTVSEDQIIQ